MEIAYIIPSAEVKEHKFENLIALCPNCDELYDKDKKISRKEMLIYKSNLGLLHHRYSEFERRVLELFCNQKQANTIQLSGLSEIPVFYLLKDDLLVKTVKNSGCIFMGVPTWEEFLLADKGSQFVED